MQLAIQTVVLNDCCPVMLATKVNEWLVENNYKYLEMHFSTACHHSGAIQYSVMIVYKV